MISVRNAEVTRPPMTMAAGDRPRRLQAVFVERFTMAESDFLWQRFEILDGKLQAMEPYFMPGYQSGPMRYYFEDMVEPCGVEDFTADWS